MKNTHNLVTPRNPALQDVREHHSVTDFDITPGAVYTLDTAQYVSAPRCLRIGGAGFIDDNAIWLCRIGATLDLPQGRLSSWHRDDVGFRTKSYVFRNQAALNSASQANMYAVFIVTGQWHFLKRVAGALTIIESQNIVTNPDTWYHDRITWWNGKDGDGNDALTVMLERYIGAAWVQQGNWSFDTANLWKESGANRVGIGSYDDPDDYAWIDNTEIWAPA